MRSARWLAFLPALASSLVGTEVSASPGIHPTIVSTWDTGASSVSGAFTTAFFTGGHLNAASYSSSFSSTSGKIGAQFGVHYLSFREGAAFPLAHGGAGTAAFVYSAPITGRHESGLPKLAIGGYVGIAPSLLINRERNYAWVPLALGVAVPAAPLPWLSFIPSFEVAAGPTLDTVIRPRDFRPDPATVIAPDGTVKFSQADIERVVRDAVSYELAFAATLRGGVAVAVHLGSRLDLSLETALGNIGKLSDGKLAAFLGGRLQFHWDSVVPAVLPPRVRLERESCEDVEARFRTCPQAPRATPEVTPSPPPVAPLAPPPPAPAAPPPPAPPVPAAPPLAPQEPSPAPTP